MAESGRPQKLADLEWSVLNNIGEDQARNSGDRRRGHSESYLDKALKDAFSKDSLKGTTYFYGIVVTARSSVTPSYTKKDTLLEDTGASEIGATQEYWIYKVYIPELESRPAPLGPDDPILYTYPDVHPVKNIDKEQIPIGSVVKVQYSNLETLKDPMIIEVEGGQFFSFEGVDLESLKTLWTSSPKELISGLSPNGNKLRSVLDRLSIPHSSNLTAGGDLDEDFVDNVIKLLENMPDDIRQHIFAFTSGVRRGDRAITGGSQHAHGNALDFTVASIDGTSKSKVPMYNRKNPHKGDAGPRSWADTKKGASHEGKGLYKKDQWDDGSVEHAHATAVEKVYDHIKSSGPSMQMQILDEYNEPYSWSTGPHFHLVGQPKIS